MEPTSSRFRVTSYVVAALFVVCVVLQYNDPDPARWMAIYGAAAAISIALAHDRRVWIVSVVLSTGALIWAAMLIYEVWDKMSLGDLVDKMSEKGGAVEQGREAGGLAIIALWLGGAGLYRRRR